MGTWALDFDGLEMHLRTRAEEGAIVPVPIIEALLGLGGADERAEKGEIVPYSPYSGLSVRRYPGECADERAEEGAIVPAPAGSMVAGHVPSRMREE